MLAGRERESDSQGPCGLACFRGRCRRQSACLSIVRNRSYRRRLPEHAPVRHCSSQLFMTWVHDMLYVLLRGPDHETKIPARPKPGASLPERSGWHWNVRNYCLGGDASGPPAGAGQTLLSMPLGQFTASLLMAQCGWRRIRTRARLSPRPPVSGRAPCQLGQPSQSGERRNRIPSRKARTR
jgi:hypothetical protein